MTSSLSFFTRRVYQLPVPPISKHKHYNRASFIDFARRHELSRTSTLFIGNLYEYTVQTELRHAAALLLHRTGGRSDNGIDHLGTWHLPGHEQPIHVAVQCKAHRRRVGPQCIRELEGVIARRVPHTWRLEQPRPGQALAGPRVGMLVNRREASAGVRAALQRSALPLVYLMVDLRGVLRQALWNEAVEALGVAPLGVEVVHGPERQLASELAELEAEGGLALWEEELRDKLPSELRAKPYPPPIRLTWDQAQGQGGARPLPGMDQIEARMLQQEEKWWALWNLAPDDQETRYEALSVIQSRFPEEKPLLWAKGGVPSLLSERDREGLLRELKMMGLSEGVVVEGKSEAEESQSTLNPT
ncbi:hypothetical protein ASPACDRAFT_1859172 [Aspergillus aculeatus ATCC 16872]|uniref:Restriction endonuclease type IV Mrr domain-containing protein n=1 Tax=Aspergillus aculeatus (strain ATCC 16872 / CBS 172.66 / WB 5094) TaxID=690307 RepID=A0A1L9WJZ4_ASPA1|nr:uncharacterized protein ASPACDRAFT_1859172 [Aspergillus aculeatus ATCC 16872]OJJ96490.1 hypothetical protein ASPACDRAFT_1859172 [Aspergillus aculeatus ATCC 16872]